MNGSPLSQPEYHPIMAAYVGLLVATIVVLALLNVWVVRGRSTSRIRAVLPLHTAAMVWAGVAALELLVVDPTLGRWLVYLRTACSYLTVVLFVYFGTVYSGRSTSLRRPFNALFLGGMGIGFLGLVTDPWLGLHFDPLVRATEPFPYYRTGFSPLWQFSFVLSYVGIAMSLYYLTELLVTSQHRSRRPLVAYSLGILLGLVPGAVTFVAEVPTLPGYDHTVLGLSMVSVGTFVGAWLGMVEIAPISRDRLLETSGDGLVVCDDTGTVVDHNEEARTFFTGERAPVGSPLATVAPALAAALDDSDGSGTAWDDSASDTEFTRDGRWYSVVISPVTDGGAVSGSALLVRDVTERVENRRELRRQNEQLDEFASSVSHHLRNPLQVAAGQTELAQDRLGESPPEDVDIGRLDDLDGALDRMAAIITDLRTLAEQGKSVESTDSVPFDATVRTAWAHVDTGSATLAIERDGTIAAEQSRLLSILENLIQNSVEHGSTSNRTESDDAVEGHGPDARDDRDTADTALSITVRLTDEGFVFEDDGCGIDADLDRLFDYGYTTSSQGTGLGLCIVQTMVQSHGWSIRVDPDHDGARFVVSDAVTSVGPAEASVAWNKQ
ncbi:histidine kinase N-terminal 7TM domain-containing protein [Haloarcula salinisoli]|uniref:histidine kinase n=1 Tax=Haloarcula salinisoli TaxID=2487746 RepID=A0A8J7YH51_9EURY|nr:histidine kinase N-terminal 7TM domain-containing protein [Halomicroarcula salinisoli]MBX0305855.1 PAS domain-containing protein [Halomicroarcula salinisoli]